MFGHEDDPDRVMRRVAQIRNFWRLSFVGFIG
jgi:hypothetical protein